MDATVPAPATEKMGGDGEGSADRLRQAIEGGNETGFHLRPLRETGAEDSSTSESNGEGYGRWLKTARLLAVDSDGAEGNGDRVERAQIGRAHV